MNRIMNSIKMGALCDALGEPLEFKTNNFENVIYDDYEITDDTEVILFFMKGLTKLNEKITYILEGSLLNVKLKFHRIL